MTFEQRLLGLVSEYEVLYNPQHPCYMKAATRNAAWDDIAQKLNSSRDKCRNRWKNLRDTYKKLLIKIHDAGGVYKYRRRKWQYLNLIAFINKYEPLAPKEDDKLWPVFEDTCKETLAMSKTKLYISQNIIDNETNDTTNSYEYKLKTEDDLQNVQNLNHNDSSQPYIENQKHQLNAQLDLNGNSYYKNKNNENEQNSTLLSHDTDNLSVQSYASVIECQQDKIIVKLIHSYAKNLQNDLDEKSEVDEAHKNKSKCRRYFEILGDKIDAAGIPKNAQINLEKKISELVHEVLAQYGHGHLGQGAVYAENIS